MNPLHTNLYRKSLSLRKLKPIVWMQKRWYHVVVRCRPQVPHRYSISQREELKSLTRYRFDKVQERAKLKQSVSRLVTILFGIGTALFCLSTALQSTHFKVSILVQSRFQKLIRTRLANILVETSRGHYRKDKATHYPRCSQNIHWFCYATKCLWN